MSLSTLYRKSWILPCHFVSSYGISYLVSSLRSSLVDISRSLPEGLRHRLSKLKLSEQLTTRLSTGLLLKVRLRIYLKPLSVIMGEGSASFLLMFSIVITFAEKIICFSKLSNPSLEGSVRINISSVTTGGIVN